MSGIPVKLNRPLFDRLEMAMRAVTRFLVPYHVDRCEGISAIVLTRDEPLCRNSVKNILPLVDEVIIIDAGEEKAEFPYAKKIKYMHTEPNQNIQFKHAMLLSKYRWLLRWDADMLANENTKTFIRMIRNMPSGYWMVKCRVANVHDDHIDSYQNEAYAFTYHPLILVADTSLLKRMTDILIVAKGGMKNRICYNMLPYFFRMKKVSCVFADHQYKSKGIGRLIERQVQAKWLLLSDKERALFRDYHEFVTQRCFVCER